jgi:hypothetical protein
VRPKEVTRANHLIDAILQRGEAHIQSRVQSHMEYQSEDNVLERPAFNGISLVGGVVLLSRGLGRIEQRFFV